MLRHLILSVFTVVLGLSAPLQAQWRHSGPQGGVATSLAVYGTNLLVGLSCPTTLGSGIFRSGDFGASWMACNNGLTDPRVMSLAVEGDYLFAGTASSGVFRSLDGGNSWQWLTGMGHDSIISFAVLGTHIFVANGHGVYRSSDDGDTWTAANDGLKELNIHSFAIVSRTLYANADYDGIGGIYRTTDLGDHWTCVRNSAFDIAAVGDHLFAAAYHNVDNGVLVTTNDGETWSEGEGGGCGVYNALHSFGTVIFSSHGSTITHSTDSGASWERDDPLHNVFAVVESRSVWFVANVEGVFRSEDLGATWTSCNEGLYQFSPSPNRGATLHATSRDLFAGQAGALLYSSDEGIHWSRQEMQPFDQTFLGFCQSGTSLYADGYTDTIRMYRSDNSGKTWMAVGTSLPFGNGWAVGIGDMNSVGDAIFVTTRGGVFRSTDKGETWEQVDVQLESELADTFLSKLVSGGTDLFAAANDGCIFRSTDLGNTWTKVREGNANTDSFGAMVVQNGIVFLKLYLSSNETRVFRSTDRGNSWSDIQDGLWDFNAMTSVGTNIFACSHNGVTRSTDNGMTWVPINDGLSDSSIYSIAASEQNLFVSNWKGVWQRPVAQIVSHTKTGGGPPSGATSGVASTFTSSSISISPNPTLRTITIHASGNIEVVTILNLLGEQVYNDWKPNPEATIDLSALASGMYFIRITTNNGMTVQTLVKQ